MKTHWTLERGVLNATLLDNPTARDFATLLPLELTLSDYAKTEKISDLPRRLRTDGAPPGLAAHAGDITYYAPWGNLAIFYRPFQYAEGLIKLGSFDGSLALLTAQTRGFSIRVSKVQSP